MGFTLPVGRRAEPRPSHYHEWGQPRIELEREYGRHIVAQSLTVWNGLTKAVEKYKAIADILVRAKAPSEAWKILKSMVEDESSERARELAKKRFEELSMNDD